MGPGACELVQQHQEEYSRPDLIRVGPDGNWVIFGHPTATLYRVSKTADDLWSVELGGERENPAVDFVTNSMHAVDVFVALEFGVPYTVERAMRPDILPGIRLIVDDEKRTQRLEWPGGWAEGPTSRRGGSRGWALPKMAHYITLDFSQICTSFARA